MIGLPRGIIPLCPARKDGCQYNKRGRGRGRGLSLLKNAVLRLGLELGLGLC